MTTSTCGGSACIAGVSRDCGHGIFRLEGGATRSQTRRDTNFAIPGDVPLSYHVLQEKATGRAQKICARPDLFAVPQFGFELPKVPKLCIFKRLRGNRNTKGNWEFAVWTGDSRRVVQGKGDVRPEQVRVDGQIEAAAL